MRLLDQRLHDPLVLLAALHREPREHRPPAERELPEDAHLVAVHLDEVVAGTRVPAQAERGRRPALATYTFSRRQT